MPTAKSKKGQIGQAILNFLSELSEMVPKPFETPYAYIRRAGSINRTAYRQATYRLKRQGMLEITQEKNKKFLKLTHKGELAALLAKAKLATPGKWDYKWRLVIFDIPEQARDKRALTRQLLKQNGFIKLQASVFINPFPINRAAIAYLQKTHLINYIRILRVDEMDNEQALLKHFKLLARPKSSA